MLLISFVHDQLIAKVRTTDVVAAAADIEAGTVFSKDNLGALTITTNKMPSGYVREEDGYVLLGHKAVVPMKRRQVVHWSYTDIVNTNK